MAVDKLVDSTQLNSDLTAVANAIRAKSGGSTPLAFPGGFVSEIESIQTGGGGYRTPYQLGGYFASSSYNVDIVGNRVRAEAVSHAGNTSIGLRKIPDINNLSTWFTINAGDTVSIVYSNVVNESNVVWNANLRQANASQSLQYGIGNGTHLNGATVTAIPTSAQNVGCLFIYVDQTFTANSILEFDVEIYVNGVRYV